MIKDGLTAEQRETIDKMVEKLEDDEDVQNVLEFERITEHPNGSDVIFYPPKGREDSPERVVKEVKEWRARNGKPGFKE